MYWYKCKFCGRETSEDTEICRGCGAIIEHGYTVTAATSPDLYYPAKLYVGLVCSSGGSYFPPSTVAERSYLAPSYNWSFT